MQAGFVHKQMVKFIRESDIVKKAQRSSFKLNPIAAAIAIAMASQFLRTWHMQVQAGVPVLT